MLKPMKTNGLLFLALALTVLCGCSNFPPKQATGKADVRTKSITKAWYVPPVNNNSSLIKINGYQMKANCTKADVESQGFAEGGQQSAVLPAIAISETSTPLYCEARIVHSPAWAAVKVRIRMNDGTWSKWTVVER